MDCKNTKIGEMQYLGKAPSLMNLVAEVLFYFKTLYTFEHGTWGIKDQRESWTQVTLVPQQFSGFADLRGFLQLE